MYTIDNVIEMAPSDGINGSIGREDFHVFIIGKSVVEIYLTSLFSTDFSIHDASTAVETNLLTMRYQDFFSYF